MVEIRSEDGDEKADIPLSEKQQSLLDHDGSVTIVFHTPQLLRGLIAIDNGSFELTKKGKVIVANNWEMVKRFIALLDNIAKAQNA